MINDDGGHGEFRALLTSSDTPQKKSRRKKFLISGARDRATTGAGRPAGVAAHDGDAVVPLDVLLAQRVLAVETQAVLRTQSQIGDLWVNVCVS